MWAAASHFYLNQFLRFIRFLLDLLLFFDYNRFNYSKGAEIMTIQFIHYPKCTTCKKAQKWLDDNGIAYEGIHIVEQTPSKEQLQAYYETSGLPLKKFFNTSGVKYRELGLKDKLATMSDDEQLTLLASDGMLIKRPLVTDGKKLTLGFKESDFLETWK